jgi:PAS domain S-box-containing protein
MTLRRRILLIIGVTLVALIVGLYKVSSSILLKDFARLEKRDVVRDVKRLQSAVSSEVADLNDEAAEWAEWDDTYQFIQDHNRAYIRSNLGETMLANVRLNVIVFLNREGQLVWGKGFDLRTQKATPIPDGFLALLKAKNLLMEHANAQSVHAGVVLLPEGVTLVVSRPIVTSQRTGPIRGTLIMGRFMDAALMKQLASSTRVASMVCRVDDPNLPADFREARALVPDVDGVYVHPLAGNLVGGYTLWNDIFGKPALLLRVEMPREIFAEGQTTIRYLVTSLLIIGLCFGTATALLLERLVLSRLSRLITDVDRIGATSDVTARVTAHGHDELTRLATALNKMLDALQRSQAELQESVTQQKFAADRVRLQGTALESAANAIVLTGRDGIVEWVNPAFTKLTGYTFAEAYGEKWSALESGCHEPAVYDKLWRTILSGEVWQGELVNRRKDGTPYTVRMTIAPVTNDGGEVAHFVAIKEDITEQKTLQEQFLQAQKVEAVGRLAGGVAHDFNNILTAINGYSELLLRKLPGGDPLYRLAEQIRKSAERAGGLTRQLLAFSRKQSLQPKILDLSNVVSDIEKMLRRLIGEDIELHTIRGAAVGNVKADPAQIEQVIMNLAVNARDAMPKGGKLTIEVTRITLSEEQAHLLGEVRPGEYVMLTVTDTGSGMTDEVKAHLFEPFFTTKPQGKGTGLGLPTCYGIVKQSGGHIQVSSEVDKGTTFNIYLPRVDAEADHRPERHKLTELPTGSETILVAEDESGVRDLKVDILRDPGYRVIQASNGEEGIRVAQENTDGRIDLLFTDVVMPQMDGKQLADWFGTARPETRVLFTSGYTADAIIQCGILEERIAFLEKPFTPAVLAQRVREVLDGNGPGPVASEGK